MTNYQESTWKVLWNKRCKRSHQQCSVYQSKVLYSSTCTAPNRIRTNPKYMCTYIVTCTTNAAWMLLFYPLLTSLLGGLFCCILLKGRRRRRQLMGWFCLERCTSWGVVCGNVLQRDVLLCRIFTKLTCLPL